MKQRIIRGFSVLLYLSAIFSGQLILTGQVHAAVNTWTHGGSDNSWSTAANWSGSTVPLATDTIILPMGSSVYLSADTTVAGITCQATQLAGTSNTTSASISGAFNLTLNGPVAVEAAVDCSFDTNTVTIGSPLVNITVADGLASVAFNNSSTTLALGANTLNVSSPIVVSATTDPINDLPHANFAKTITGTSASKISVSRLWSTPGSSTTTTGFLGTLELNDSVMDLQNSTPPYQNVVSINMLRSQLYFETLAASTFTFAAPLSINGNLFGATGDNVGFLRRAITSHTFADSNSTPAAKFTGSIALSTDVSVGAIATGASSIEFSGAISGSHILGWSGVTDDNSKLIISSSANGSLIPSGSYRNILGTVVTYSDSVPAENLIINIATASVNGQRGNIVVAGNGVLKGTGTVRSVLVLSGGMLAPGNSPGCLNTGNLSISTGSSLDAEVTGTVVCSGYDQTKVTGTVTLTNPTLNLLVSGFSPAAGNAFTIIDNDGNDAVVGTFNGLAEGATFVLGSANYKISYVGGDGNDVVVSVVGAVPKTPNTGFADITSQKLMVGGLMVTVAGLLIAKKSSKLLVRTK